MYGENLTQGNKAQARRGRRSGANRASRRFKQHSLSHAIRTSNKAAVRPCDAIQHLQQRFITSLVSIHERKARLDFCRSISQSESGVNRQVADCANSTGIATKQSKLVWLNLASYRQYQRLRDYCQRVASWFLCKMAKNRLTKKLSSPCGGLIDPSISPYCGLIVMAISPYCGLIKGCFDTFLSPYCGHLLVIPLYTALIGD